MPIAVTCPHCQTRYPKIPDGLAGKTVKCKKEECRQDFLVPVPLSAAELEAAALAALDDAPAAQAGGGTATDQRTIPMTCTVCEHKFAVPFEKAGKNVLCENPDCRARLKVPVPKDEKGVSDWRSANTGRPSLAKENFEKPADVQDAEAKMVSGEALRGAGLGLPELEPRSVKRTLFFFAFLPLTALALVFFGGKWYFGRRADTKADQLVLDAVKEFTDTADESRPPPAEYALSSAVLQMSAGEYFLRSNTKGKLKDVMGYYSKARADVTQAAGKDDKKQATSERYVVGCELAVAMLSLGGTDSQVADDVRLRWTPDPAGGRQLRPNERRDSVHGELSRTLGILMPADFDLKASLLRRLVRELVKKGQLGLAAELPTMLFNTPEQPEAKAILAVELYRADKNSEAGRRIADELKTQLQTLPPGLTPVPATAQTVWLAFDTAKPPTVAQPPSAGGGEILDSTRHAYTGWMLLQGQHEEAVKMANRPGGAAGRLRALALCADWSPDPTAALTEATGIIGVEVRKKDSILPQFTLLRLAQLAAAAGKEDAKALSDAIADEGLRVWAKADGVRLRLSAKPEKADEGLVELPDDVKKYRVGHAWGRLAVARANGAVAKDRAAAKQFANWPKGTIHPFALVGVALGLQDQ